jgi:hypothetical protein
MFIEKVVRLSIGVSLVAALTGCTIHPAGEGAEREAAFRAGKPFTHPVEDKDLPPLPDRANPAGRHPSVDTRAFRRRNNHKGEDKCGQQ